MNEFESSPKTWPPLGLPTGSVRALLTLIVVAVVVTRVALGRPPDPLWIETLLIALAHYFTSRRFVSLSPAVLQRLEQEGVIEKERHPLYLPRNSIRTIIIGAFVGLGVYLYREPRLITPEAIALLSMVFAYLLGAIVRGISSWFTKRLRNRLPVPGGISKHSSSWQPSWWRRSLPSLMSECNFRPSSIASRSA